MYGKAPQEPHLRKSFYFSLGAALLVVLCGTSPAFSADGRQDEKLIIDTFSEGPAQAGPPAGWRELTFPGIRRHTVYTVAGDGTERCLRAVSERSASAVYKEVRIDTDEYPVLSWRWKVDGVVEGGDARTRAGDDYAARVYVTFEYRSEDATLLERLRHKAVERIYGTPPPGTAINYIWANRLPKDSSVPNPYTGKSIMVAVQSGPGLAGRWLTEERNIREDYEAFFGTSPPPVTGVAVMTDTDNTGTKASACYDDIIFTRRR